MLKVVYLKCLFLEPLHFAIFIDDIVRVFSEIFKFAYDTKIVSEVNTLNDVRSIQRN